MLRVFTSLTWFLIILFSSNPAFTQDAETTSPVENKLPKIRLSGTADFRAVFTQKAPNWSTCPDGTGMQCMGAPLGATRYGGNISKGKTLFDLSQLTLDIDADMTGNLILHTQVNLDLQSDGPSRFGGGSIHVIESYVTLKNVLKNNGNLRVGIFTPPFSRENHGPHWTTRYTITPSAINTWLATIIRVYGVEASFPLKDSGFSLTGSLFGGADEANSNGPGAGKDPILRGWLMHDYWMPVHAVVSEEDGKLGFYGKLFYEDPAGKFDMDLGYYDNNGDILSSLGTDVWGTHFLNIGARVSVGENAVLLGQYVDGRTEDWKDTASMIVKCDFKSYYLMGLYNFHAQQMHFSLRYDYYKVNRAIPSYLLRNEGSAWTLALGKQLDDSQRLMLEVLSMKDDIRSGVAGDVPDDLAQLSYKISF